MLKNVSIIIPVAPNETAHEILQTDLEHTDAQIIISSESSRAKSLNAGATKAKHEMLWFLHADSRVNQSNIIALEKTLQQYPKGLHYFQLGYDGYGLTKLNAIGANIRSKTLALPYGDQGFCLSKEQFNMIGGYPEDVAYGEDLLFVRLTKRHKINLCPIPSKLVTSARKYKEQGWFKLTLLRQFQMIKLMRQSI